MVCATGHAASAENQTYRAHDRGGYGDGFDTRVIA